MDAVLNLLYGAVVLHGRFDFGLNTSAVICGRFSPIVIRTPTFRLAGGGRLNFGLTDTLQGWGDIQRVSVDCQPC